MVDLQELIDAAKQDGEIEWDKGDDDKVKISQFLTYYNFVKGKHLYDRNIIHLLYLHWANVTALPNKFNRIMKDRKLISSNGMYYTLDDEKMKVTVDELNLIVADMLRKRANGRKKEKKKSIKLKSSN